MCKTQEQEIPSQQNISAAYWETVGLDVIGFFFFPLNFLTSLYRSSGREFYCWPIAGSGQDEHAASPVRAWGIGAKDEERKQLQWED